MVGWEWREFGSRPLCFPSLALGLGVGLGGLTTGASFSIPILAALCAGISVWLGRRPFSHLLLLLAVALTGVALAHAAASTTVPAELREGGEFRLEGVLESVEPQADSITLQLAVARVEGVTVPASRFRARLFSHGTALSPWTPGQRVVLKARLKPLQPPLNWGESDLSAVWARRGVAFSGSVDASSVVPVSPPSRLKLWLVRTRQSLGVSAHRVAPNADAAALYATLAAGLRAELGKPWELQFSQSGLAHVLSVSGLHVAALALLSLKLLRQLLLWTWRGARTRDARRIAALFSIPPLWAYVIFTGNQAAAVRSAVMASTVFLALALWRQADALNSLALAAMALLIWDPASLLDLSLQLSFSAVLSLILLSGPIRAAIPLARPDPVAQGVARHLSRARETALQAFAASLAVTLGGAVLVAGTFHRLSVAGLFSNIVCMPLCGILTVLSAGGAALFVAWPPAALPFFWLGTRASQLLLFAVALFAKMPGAALPVPSFDLLGKLVFGAGLCALALARGRARWGWLLVPTAFLSLVIPSDWGGEDVVVTFLSVGQGDSTLLEVGRDAVLVDGGGVPGGSDPGERVVIPYLRERHIHRLRLTALSHPHPDHALGLISTLRAVPTEELWLPLGNRDGPLTDALVAAAGRAKVEQVGVGHAPLVLGAARLSILGPPLDSLLLKGVNDRSLILRLEHRNVSFLLPGDVEAAGEEQLPSEPVTVLKAPHHGSSTSSSSTFVRGARPRHVVFCVGRHNRFHFPHRPVVERYTAAGAACYRTDLQGAIRFRSDGESVRVETFVPDVRPSVRTAVEVSLPHDQDGGNDPGRPRPEGADREP